MGGIKKKYCYIVKGNDFFREPLIYGISIQTKKEIEREIKNRGFKWSKKEELFVSEEAREYMEVEQVEFEDW